MGHNVLDTLPFPAHMTAGYSQTYSAPDGSLTRISPYSTGVLNNASSPFYDNDNTSTAKFRPDLAGKVYSVIDSRNGTYQPKLLRCVQLNCTGATAAGVSATPGPTMVALLVQPYYQTGYTTYYMCSQGTALQMGNNTVAATHGRFGVVAMQGGYLGGNAIGAVGYALPTGFTAAGTNSAPTTGRIAKPLYDGYTAGRALLCGDWVYVVEEGPCIVPIGASQTATAGKEATSYSDGGWRDATAGDTVCGTWSLVNQSATDQVVAGTGILRPYQGLLMVRAGYQDFAHSQG